MIADRAGRAGNLIVLAVDFFDQLGNAAVPLDAFHLLFSGGRIGGEIKTDVARMREIRRAVPHIALLGGGVSNQILPGKIRVSDSLPVCREAIPALPESLHDEAGRVSYRGLAFERSFSRMDDGKNPKLLPYIRSAADLLDGPAEAKGKKDGPADQMRMTCELLAPGVRLYTEIDCLDVSEVELGCLTAALHRFSRSPHIGGQSNRGHGRVALDYDLMDLDTGAVQPFLRVADGPAALAPPAEAAKSAYDQHLREVYNQALDQHAGEIKVLLGAA